MDLFIPSNLLYHKCSMYYTCYIINLTRQNFALSFKCYYDFKVRGKNSFIFTQLLTIYDALYSFLNIQFFYLVSFPFCLKNFL